ncbi:hypothetical protein ACROYT_G024582 [Oculina patagonica]
MQDRQEGTAMENNLSRIGKKLSIKKEGVTDHQERFASKVTQRLSALKKFRFLPREVENLPKPMQTSFNFCRKLYQTQPQNVRRLTTM